MLLDCSPINSFCCSSLRIFNSNIAAGRCDDWKWLLTYFFNEVWIGYACGDDLNLTSMQITLLSLAWYLGTTCLGNVRTVTLRLVRVLPERYEVNGKLTMFLFAM